MAAAARQKTANERAVGAAKGLVRVTVRLGRPLRGKTLISEERLLKTAIALIDESGVQALTMRRLAERLSVTAMSLYRYIDSHETLLDAVKWAIVDKYPPCPVNSEQSYREVLTETAKALRRAFRAHPQAVTLFATRPATRASAHQEAVIGRLVQAGFEPLIANYLMDAVVAFTVGLSLEQFAQSQSGTGKLSDYEAEFIIGIMAIIDGFGSRYAKRGKWPL